MSFLHLVSKLFAGSNHIFPNPGPIAITLCWGHVSLLGQANTKWLPQGKAAPIVSHQQRFYTPRFLMKLRPSFSSLLTTHRPFSSQSHLLVRPVLGHVLHAAEFKVLGGRWQNARGLSAQHQGGGQQGGEMLKSKVHRTGHRQFTTQL